MSEKKPQIDKGLRKHIAERLGVDVKEICTNCGRKIQTLIFRGTGVCCEDCRKDRDGDHEPAGAIVP